MTHAEAIEKAKGDMYQVVIYETGEDQGKILFLGTLKDCSEHIEQTIAALVHSAYFLSVDIRGQKEFSTNTGDVLTTGYNLYWGSPLRTHRITVDRY
jgi:hypothetical protein